MGDGWDEKRFVTRARSRPSGTAGRVLWGVLAHGSDEDYEEGRDLIESGAPLRLVTLPLLNPALRVCVVVPPETRWSSSARARGRLAEQVGVSYEEYEVARPDDCTDSTEMREGRRRILPLLSDFT